MRGLRHNSTLTYLDLSFNSIGTNGGISVGIAIARSLSLARVGLAQNRIGVDAAVFFAEGLRLNTHLEFLDVAENQLIGILKSVPAP